MLVSALSARTPTASRPGTADPAAYAGALRQVKRAPGDRPAWSGRALPQARDEQQRAPDADKVVWLVPWTL